MATGGLYGSSPNGTLIASPASETSGLYGGGTSFAGTYFEWFIFKESATQPATPTGGSWSFVTNTGTPPTGWTVQPPTAPVNEVWVSIALVNSRNGAALSWSVPGLFGTIPYFTFGTVITGAPGTNASVVNTGTAVNPTLVFTIPRGDVGATGATGPQGPTGLAATVAIGTTTTGAAGTSAIVTNSGTTSAAVFNFTIPRGQDGTNGAAATIAVGTTTTGAPGTSASVTNSGTSSAAVFNFTIPQGATGATGPTGPAGPGVPVGGTTGQALIKNSGTNYDTTWATPATGTVTSVAATVPSFLSVSGSPITTSGTLALTYSGTALPVANGGTGVTSSSGANSVVLRDANGNITTNCLFEGYSTVAASGTTITLIASSAQNYQITGSGGQVIKLPDATTLSNGATFTFNNNQSSGAITVQNNSSTTIATINSGGYVTVVLLSNSIAAGSWDRHDSTPSNVSWSTNTLDYTGSITSATWNGNAVAINRGGTNGTATPTAGAIAYGSGTAYAFTSAGTSGQVLTSAGSSAPTFSSTIDGIAIGGTTPSTGTFTTLTAQTEVLNGTGMNFFVYSQLYSNGNWGNSNSVLTSGQTDPLSGSTAFLLAENTTNGQHYIQEQPALTFGNYVYTFSTYIKSGLKNQAILAMSDGSSGNAYALFDTNAGTTSNIGTGITGLSIGSWTSLSATIISVGSGWYRCSLTATKNAGTIIAGQIYNVTSSNISYAGTNGSGVYIWGSQLEYGSVVRTYQATTSSIIFNQPTLSLAGAGVLGLQSDGSLYVSPAGTGALQAQKTDSSATGGNARGANAVDLQTSRSSAGQVASNTGGVLVGGISNSNTTAQGVVVGGGYNSLFSNGYSVLVGGNSNQVSGVKGALVGGYANNLLGYYGFIGGGQANSGTANAAVTTQSATMNGTTAVTLSGSNASIKVGQLITGTNIQSFPDTYVAAISGTSLTLSQAASGSGTNNINFYTPHGVVVGGGNNQATGSYSFIGGGGDAGTAANRNTASGAWSTVVGGAKNTASGIGSFIGGGGYDGTYYANIAGGNASVIAGGTNNNTSAQYGSVLGGFSNYANGSFSTALGANSTARSITGNISFAPCFGAISYSIGVSQASLLVLGKQTTDATATVITSDGASASGTNQVILPNNSAYYFRGEIIAGVTGAGNTKGWYVEGVIKRGSGVGTTALVGTPTVSSLYADVGAATWAVTATADTTNGGLAITVTGQASTTIRWVAQIRTTEMTY